MHNSEQGFLQYFSSADLKELHKRDPWCLHRRKLEAAGIQITPSAAVGLDAVRPGLVLCTGFIATLPPCWLQSVIITYPDFSGATCQNYIFMTKIVEGSRMLQNSIFYSKSMVKTRLFMHYTLNSAIVTFSSLFLAVIDEARKIYHEIFGNILLPP